MFSIHLFSALIPGLVSPADNTEPVPFLVLGFVLVLIFFLLINIDRRFREYISRSFLRPFNFFADIRDQRLIPNVQTTLLAFVIAGGFALVLGALVQNFTELINLRQGAGYELSTPIVWLQSYARLPALQLILLLLLSLVAIVAVTLLLRFAAIFVRQRIFLGDTWNVTVWSCLPAVLLVPYGLLLPRMDRDSLTLIVTLVIVGAILFWLIFRFMKGIGVLFDVYPSKIYLYGSIFLVVIAIMLGVVFKFVAP